MDINSLVAGSAALAASVSAIAVGIRLVWTHRGLKNVLSVSKMVKVPVKAEEPEPKATLVDVAASVESHRERET